MRSFLSGPMFCAALLLALAACPVGAALAAPCTPNQIAAAVDKAGTALRAYNKDAQPQLKERCEKLAAVKGWPKNQAEEKCLEYLQDGRIAELDMQANEYLTEIDQLGRVEPGATVECSTLAALDEAGKNLLNVMATKSGYLAEKIDRETAPKEAAKSPPPAAEKAKPAPEPQKSAQATARPAQEEPKPVPAHTPFETTIIPSDEIVTGEEGYTIDEIREATRGFFGTISTELASVIEHAFAKTGRPTAYILGTEGGGALLAGLRYGTGTLYMRKGGSQPIYWHGPTIGSDIGAEGSRTLYLVYRLTEPNRLYRRFGGIDGSAYFVGGVGVTFLKGGDVIMAPIRSGLGLRLGANIGYVRFTPQPTWNPF